MPEYETLTDIQDTVADLLEAAKHWQNHANRHVAKLGALYAEIEEKIRECKRMSDVSMERELGVRETMEGRMS
jgi:hypothetical protein